MSFSDIVFLMKLMVWNCQGAASREFVRVLKDLLKHHKLDILGLLEPKVSGSHADEVCQKLGFKEWIRVEAVGFSGGIWIFWNSSLVIDVVHTHPQFILLKVKLNI